jgi:hypothetical protein
MNFEELNLEQKLIVFLSRKTFSIKTKESIGNIIKSSNINWFEILKYSIKNRVIGLVYYNLKEFNLTKNINPQILKLFEFYYIGNKNRNKVYLEELNKLMKEFNFRKIPCFPLKGAYLLQYFYKDLGSRSINDLDFLVNFYEFDSIDSLMKSYNYIQGDYDSEGDIIKEFCQEKNIAWKLKMHSFPSFTKKCESEFLHSFQIDFSFSLDLNKDIEPVKEMIEGSKNNIFLENKYFFIHLCCHLYKEATGAFWVNSSSDLNLIKFCDIREYIINFMDKQSLKESIIFAQKYNLEKSLFYTLYYLKEIYDDGYEYELLDLLNVNDTNFLNYFGEYDLSSELKWKKTFWERVFSENNKDELKDEKTYLKNFENFLNF